LRSGATFPAAARGTPSEFEFAAVVVQSADALTEHVPALEDLSAAALEPNVFAEPWMFFPAAHAFAGKRALEFVLVYARSRREASGPRTLCGFFPFEKQRRWKGLPISVVRIWRHVYSVLGTPLMRADCARACWAFFLDWLRRAPTGACLLELPFVTGDGPFDQLLVDQSNDQGTLDYSVETFTRALFRPRASSDEYLAAALSGKRRQELRRMERRLAEAGAVRYAVLEPNDAPEPWIAAFLDLEARGWKGREGTALARHETDRCFFHAFTREAHRRGRLQMLGLFLDDRPIALKCNLLAGAGGYAFKIAFDEAFARYSPGVLLELFTIRHLHDHAGLAWMDSCAIPNHPMIDRLWLDRRTIQTVLISTGRCPGDLVVSLLPALRWMKRELIGRPGANVASTS
jgi:hypothetical protein